MILPRVSSARVIATNVKNVLTKQTRGGKRQNTCYLPVCEAKVIEPKKDSQELCKAGTFIVNQHYPYEPILMSNQIVPTTTLTQYYQNAARDGILLYGVVESKDGIDKLGIAIAKEVSKNAYNEIMSLASRIKNRKTRNYLTLLAELEKKKNIRALYETDKILSVEILTTTIDFRRRQVSQMLLQGLIDEAYKRNIEVMRIMPASEFAAKAAAKLGFTAIYTVAPETLRNLKGEALAPHELCLPHKSLKIMIMDLRKRARPKKEEPPCIPHSWLQPEKKA